MYQLRHTLLVTINVLNFYPTSRPIVDQLKLRPTVAAEVEVTDISGSEAKYTLDSHGFQIVKHKSKEVEFLDENQIKNNYYPETEQLLKNVYEPNPSTTQDPCVETHFRVQTLLTQYQDRRRPDLAE